jgi:acyl-CoA hydrolase
MNSKFPKDSLTEVTYMVLPNDTNPLGLLRGGVLMEWMDIASEITSQRHSQSVCLTIGIDAVSFKRPIKSGDIVYLKAQVTRAFNTSLEIFVQVWASSTPKMKMRKTNEAFFTFVAVDKKEKPTKIPTLTPQNKIEKELYESALERKEHKIRTSPHSYKSIKDD